MSGCAKKSHSQHSKPNKLLLKHFTDGTFHSPSLPLCLELVSKLYYRHILLHDSCQNESQHDFQWEEKFDIDNYLPTKYSTILPFTFVNIISSSMIYFQQKQKCQIGQTSHSKINIFLSKIFKKLRLNVELSIIALIYTERLMKKRYIDLTLRNWKPIMIASILIASKVWDDLCSWNIEFSNLISILTLANINKLEGLYLDAIQYDLYISTSEYAKYYFALHGLKHIRIGDIPRCYLSTKKLSTKSIQVLFLFLL